MTSCTACAAGSYCPTPGVVSTCPAGYYCPATSAEPGLCPMATSCSTTAYTACTASDKYALYGSGACSAMTFFTGYYQSAGTPYYKTVTLGKYYNFGAAGYESTCTLNNYCPYGAQIACPSGYATRFMSSTTGQYYCTRCAYGSACYLSAPIETLACYNNTRYSKAMHTDCFQCPSDYDCAYQLQYFEFRDNIADNLKCQPGKYANYFDNVCSEIKQVDKSCSYGYQRVVNAADVLLHAAEQRVTCKQYTYYATNPLPTGKQTCITGTYKESTVESCLVSPPGYIMPGTNTEDYDPLYVCPQGFYCGIDFDYLSSTISLQTSRCPPATYARDTFTGGMTDSETCLICPPGKYCKGDSLATPCDAGYICDIGTITQTLKCPSGFFYDTTKTGVTFYDRCVQCTSGMVCASLSTAAVACPLGYYCGSQSADLTAYSSRPGFYIGTSGGSETSCEAGKYCPQAATVGIDCPV